ncbi:MAG: CvpA family protein [Sporolactobacillus sp.]
MLLDLIILLLLASGLFMGFRRGLILQVVRLGGFIVSYLVAVSYFKKLAPVLKFWIPFPSSAAHSGTFDFLGPMNLQTAYYQAIAFIILFIAVKIVLTILGSMLDFLAEFPLIRPVNHLTGAALGFVEIYLVVFLLLYASALTPISGLQSAINDSSLAQSIIGHTPVFSQMIKNMWIAFINFR